MAEDLPGGFYENIDRKNWTVNVIQYGLGINNEYITIYTAIETEIRSQNILGHKLNQSLVKKQLKLILANIIPRFSTTFDAIPLLWREKCLMAIAQKCNYNMRRSMRHRTTISESLKHQADSMCQDVTKPPQNIMEPPPQRPSWRMKQRQMNRSHFVYGHLNESIMVFITMATSERCTICRMVDFVIQGSSGNLTIESLAFDRFTSILKEDIQFNLGEHNIFYRCTKGMAVAITNERSWKAAIRDMYAGGMDSFDFHVEKNGEYMSGHSLAYF